MRGSHLRRVIDMRMTEYQFINQMVTDIGYIKLLLFFSHSGIETHMEQHISELLADLFHIILDECITQLISFLYRIGTQAFIGLFFVPRAFFPKCVENIEHTPESFHFFFSCMHCHYNYNSAKVLRTKRKTKILFGIFLAY